MKNDIRKIAAVDTEEGAGVHVRRLFPTAQLKHIDPFVLLDEFFLDPSVGFPAHPHRGFEAVTYMLEGSFRHEDNLGNATEVAAGGVQRFTAGKGLVHSEMPGNAPMNHGFQLWVNLPHALKQTGPDYQQVEPDLLPESVESGVRVRRVVGESSPVKLHTPVSYEIISLEQGQLPVVCPEGRRGFLYLYRGGLRLDGVALAPSEGVLLEAGERLQAQADSPCSFILVTGRPHGEAILLHGSFVD